MFSADILKSMECVIPHKCNKLIDKTLKCVYCEVGYSFIVHEPIVLQCGHHICKECIAKTVKGSLNCKICSQEIKCTGTTGTAAETLVQLFSKDLAKELKEKLLTCVDAYDGKR
jgi:hypothetical protein